jgi:hypothetical protein
MRVPLEGTPIKRHAINMHGHCLTIGLLATQAA